MIWSTGDSQGDGGEFLTATMETSGKGSENSEKVVGVASGVVRVEYEDLTDLVSASFRYMKDEKRTVMGWDVGNSSGPWTGSCRH